MPDMHDVESSNIAAIGYDQPAKELHVRFKGRPAVYVYRSVPMDRFEDLMRSESKGQYLSRMIKGTYEVTKLEEVAVEPIPDDGGADQFVKGREHLEKHILGEEHAPNEPQDLLTLTMPRSIFEALQRLLGNTPLNADDGTVVHAVLAERVSGVATLETTQSSSFPGEAEED